MHHEISDISHAVLPLFAARTYAQTRIWLRACLDSPISRAACRTLPRCQSHAAMYSGCFIHWCVCNRPHPSPCPPILSRPCIVIPGRAFIGPAAPTHESIQFVSLMTPPNGPCGRDRGRNTRSRGANCGLLWTGQAASAPQAGRAERHVGVMRERLAHGRYSPSVVGALSTTPDPYSLVCIASLPSHIVSSRPSTRPILYHDSPSPGRLAHLYANQPFGSRAASPRRAGQSRQRAFSADMRSTTTTCTTRHMPSYRAVSASCRTVPYKHTQDGHLAGLQLGTACARWSSCLARARLRGCLCPLMSFQDASVVRVTKLEPFERLRARRHASSASSRLNSYAQVTAFAAPACVRVRLAGGGRHVARRDALERSKAEMDGAYLAVIGA